MNETTALLAARAPTLEQGLRRARRKGWAYVIVDGTLIACDRMAADRPFCSGEHKRHGMNIQVVSAPDGEPLWTSWSLPGAVHDRPGRTGVEDRRTHQDRRPDRAGRQGIRRALRRRVLPVQGPGANRSGRRTPDSAHTKLRTPGEPAITQLKNWDILHRLRCCPQRSDQITRAVLVLQFREAGRKRFTDRRSGL